MPQNNDDQHGRQKKSGGMQPISSILQHFALDDKGGRITQEFQDYGYRLAVELDDLQHKSLYIKMAKTVDRTILEEARTFMLDANAKSKARLFMWKVKELRMEKQERGKGSSKEVAMKQRGKSKW